MSSLVGKFVVASDDVTEASARLLTEYFHGASLPESPLNDGKVADTLVVGGHGVGKSTFARNWSLHPVLMQNAVHLNQRQCSEICEGINAGFNGTSQIEGFLDWSNLSAIMDSSGMRILQRRAHESDGYYPLRMAHIILSDPHEAHERIESRAEQGGHSYPMDSCFMLRHSFGRFVWAEIVQISPQTCIWNCSDGALNLMAYVQTDMSEKLSDLRFYDDDLLASHNLSGAVMDSMFGLVQSDPHAMRRMRRFFEKRTSRINNDFSIEAGRIYRLSGCEAFAYVLENAELDSSTLDCLRSNSHRFIRAALPEIPEDIQPYTSLDPLEPWLIDNSHP